MKMRNPQTHKLTKKIATEATVAMRNLKIKLKGLKRENKKSQLIGKRISKEGLEFTKIGLMYQLKISQSTLKRT